MMSVPSTTSVMGAVRPALLTQADLFDHPRAYRAGVEDALRALKEAFRPQTLPRRGTSVGSDGDPA